MCDAESDGLGLGGVVICVHDEIRLGEEEEEGGEEDEGDSLISKSIVYMYVCVCVDCNKVYYCRRDQIERGYS